MHPPLSSVTPPAIRLHGLTLGYGRHLAVQALNLCIGPGSMIAVVGPNGAGKSTLITALAGGMRALSGRMEGLTQQRTAWLPQQSAVDFSFPIDVRGMVSMGLWHRIGAWGRFTAEHRRQCDEALAQVGLSGFASRGLDTLSGGQRQRALFARLILQDAPVVLLDEPFAAVDNRTTDDLLVLLQRWHAQGKTVIAVLHDLPQVRAHFPLTLLLARELIAFGPTAGVLTDANWARAQHIPDPFDEPAPRSNTVPMASARSQGKPVIPA